MGKLVKIVLLVVIAVFIVVFALRLFSGEDSWICDHGKWVRHGHPSDPAPTTRCD